MEDLDFRGRIQEQVTDLAADFTVTPDKAFLIWAGTLLFRMEPEDAYAAATLGGKNDVGLDFGFIDKSENRVILAQGKYSESVSREAIRSLAALPAILDDPAGLREKNANAEVRDFARDFRLMKRRGAQISLYLVHLGSLTADIAAEIGGIVDVGSSKLKETYEATKEVVFSPPPSEIDLDLLKDRFFKLEDHPGHARCFVAQLPLSLLHDLYRTYREGLLDRNIRLYAGKNTPANSGMTSTLSNEEEAPRFFYYNNGLCIYCTKIGKPQETHTGVRIKLHNPQIVNGGQTYHTVGTLDETFLTDAFVLARIVSPPEKPGIFEENVIRFNNTQTLVTSRDFHANDPIQKSLFEKITKQDPPWFYERKLGLWEAVPKAERTRFRREGPGGHGDSRKHFRIIDSELMAQCRLAWDGTPAVAKTKKRRIFEESAEEDGLYSTLFGPGADSEDSVSTFLIAYKLNEMIQQKHQGWTKAKAQAKDTHDDAKLRKLEELSFIPFFDFFALASIRFVMERFYTTTPISRALDQTVFDPLYDLLLNVFKLTISAEKRAVENTGKTFSLANWFKSDQNYEQAIKPQLEAQGAFLPKKLPT